MHRSFSPHAILFLITVFVFAACADRTLERPNEEVEVTQDIGRTDSPASPRAPRGGFGITIGTGGMAGVYDDSWRYAPPVDREGYAHLDEIGFRRVVDAPLSTFSIDVDRASYANTRRMLNDGYLPPPDAVRIEEFVNYFDYHYDAPSANSEHPFAVYTEVATAPWNDEHQLVRIALQGERIETENLPPANLVFLIDVSGSMNSPDKLPLLVRSF